MRISCLGPYLCSITLLVGVGCGQASTSVNGQAAATPVTAKSSPPNATPPTIAEAAKVLDLSLLPLVPSSEEPGARTVARLTYHAKASPRDAYAFHQKELLAQKWATTPGEYVSDDSASATFTREGYTLSMSTSLGGRVDDVKTSVVVANHGNLTLSTLPQPGNSTLLYDFPVTLAYSTPTPVEQTAAEIDKALLAAGWEPYGAAGDSRFYRQKAIRLTATTSAAPAQEGKTVVRGVRLDRRTFGRRLARHYHEGALHAESGPTAGPTACREYQVQVGGVHHR